MRPKPNHEIRTLIKNSNVYAYEAAEHLGIHENTLFRMLRRELSESERERILASIEAIQSQESIIKNN